MSFIELTQGDEDVAILLRINDISRVSPRREGGTWISCTAGSFEWVKESYDDIRRQLSEWIQENHEGS